MTIIADSDTQTRRNIIMGKNNSNGQQGLRLLRRPGREAHVEGRPAVVQCPSDRRRRRRQQEVAEGHEL